MAHVLLIGPDTDTLAALRRVLVAEGHTVSSAADLTAALARPAPDIVIAGAGLLEELRRLRETAAQVEEVERRNRQLTRSADRSRKLQSIFQAMAATLDPLEMMDILAEKIVTHLGYKAAVLGVYSDEENALKLAALYPKTHLAEAARILGGDPWRLKFPLPDNQILNILARGKMWQSESFYDFASPVLDRQAADSLQALYGVRHHIVVPVMARGRLVGSILAGCDSEIDPEARQILLSLARHAALSIENARLFEAEQRRTVQLETASMVARDAAAILDVNRLLDEVVRLISDRFGFYHAGVFLIDDSGQFAVLEAASSAGGQRMLERGHRLAVGKVGIVGYVAKSGEPRIALDVGRDAVHFANPDLPETRSEMALPLIGRGRIIGVLDVQSEQEAAFTREDVATLQTLADQLAVAIENARLFEAEQRRRRETETLYRASQALATTLDLPRLFERILSELQQVVPYDSASVQLLHGDYLEIIGGHGFPNLDELLGLTFDLAGGDNPNQEVIRRRETFIVEDVLDRYSRFDEPPHKAAGIRAWMGVPLLLGDRLIGMLSLDKRQPGFYTAEHARLAEAFAVQAAVAIENARLYDEAQRHVEELTALRNIDLAITSTLKLDEVLQIVYEQVADLMDTATFYIGLYDKKQRVLRFPFLMDNGVRLYPAPLPINGHSGLSGWVVRTRRPLWIGDLEQEQDTLPVKVIPVGVPTRSLMIWPLIAKDEVIGVISVQSAEPHAFDEGHRRMFAGIAGQVAIAVENARLFEEMTRYAHGLRALARASGKMIGSLNKKDIIAGLLEALVERFQAQCSILLIDEEEGSATLEAVWSPDDMSYPFPVGHRVQIIQVSALREVIETRRPLYIPDIRRSQWWKTPSAPERYVRLLFDSITSVLLVPMLSQERVAGIVSIRSAKPLPEPVEEQMDWVQTLVNQAATALASAHLYHTLEEKTAELSAAYEELKELSRLRTELVQNVGHELRTPLSLIEGYVELLLAGDLGRLSPPQKSALEVVYQRTESLKRLIYNLTMLQHVPRESLVLKPVSLVNVARHAIRELDSRAQRANITFYDEMPAGLPLVLGDRERLELAFSHLVENAIKFSPDGGIVTFSAWAEKGSVYVSISDQGIGIPPEHIGRIFERFYQVDGSASRRFGGMGVGLALVWEIVEAHDGTVSVESEEGKGSTFTVALPQCER